MAKKVLNIEEILELEQPLKNNKYFGNNNLPSFTIIEGKNPVVISAVHPIKTTEKVMSSRNIISAIALAINDEDQILEKIITGEIITSPRDIDIDPIMVNENEPKKKISVIAEEYDINPYVLRYYFYKTALEQEKEEEPFTAAYALYLAKALDCFAYIRNNNLVANASVDHQNPAFIKFLKEAGIKLHMDLHGARYYEDKSKNNFDIAFGTNHGQYVYNYEAFKNIARTSYALYSMTNIRFETEFQAGTNRTLCNQVYRYSGINSIYGIQTFQAEVSGEYRRPTSRPEDAIKFLSGTIDFFGSLMDEEKGRTYGKVPRS